jgi:hypothetical protein
LWRCHNKDRQSISMSVMWKIYIDMDVHHGQRWLNSSAPLAILGHVPGTPTAHPSKHCLCILILYRRWCNFLEQSRRSTRRKDWQGQHKDLVDGGGQSKSKVLRGHDPSGRQGGFCFGVATAHCW